MITDDELVKAAARALAKAEWANDPDSRDTSEDAYADRMWESYVPAARAALDAINASGTHWIAPHTLPPSTVASLDATYGTDHMRGKAIADWFEAARDAYLAEQKAGLR